MTKKPTYEELEQRVKGLELEAEKRKHAEERFRLAAQVASDLVYEWDIASDTLLWFGDVDKVLGYEPGELPRTIEAWVGLIHPDDQKQLENAVEHHRESTDPIMYEYRIQRKDDTWLYWRDQGAPLLDDNGRPRKWIGVCTDKTKRKQAEEALEKSEEKYRTILESIEEGYYEVDIAGNFTFFNDSLCEILGYPKAEMMGMNDRQYTDKENAKKLYQTFNRVYTTGQSSKGFDWEIIRKDGTKKHIEASVSLIKGEEGHRTGFRGIVRDVTDRKQMEEELINTKNFLQNILDSSIDGISTTDLKGEVLYCNPRLKDMIGYDLKEVIGKKVSTFYWNGIEDAKKIMKELMAIGEIRNREAQFKKKGGGFVDAILSASLLRDEGGEVTGTLGIFKDIGDKKKLEAQVQQSQKMEAIATLAGGIAHQFNNALTSITGHTGLLEMSYPEDEKITKYARAMKQSAHRMADLTSQLLAYARGGKYNPQIISLTDFVEGTLPLIQHTIDPAISVETDLPLDILNVKADHTQMQMVLSAIVANASEAIEGPGRIRITTRNEEFAREYPYLKQGPYVCLSIEDDGKGMDEETRARIFDPFFTTHFIGRGLGMAAVYGIIRNHDGWIRVESESGKGTTVYIYLPACASQWQAGLPATCPPVPGVDRRVAAEEEVKEVVRPKVQPTKGKGTILIIEDEEDVMNITRQVLGKLGYRVLEAKTGREAIEIAKGFDGQIDLALLDIKLPDTGGDKLYPLMMEARPDLKIIAFSGYAIDGPPQEILDAGAQGFIQKPFLISTLSEKVEEVLEA